MPIVTVALLYDSASALMAMQAVAVACGAAAVPGTLTLLIGIERIDTHWAKLQGADVVVFGAAACGASASRQLAMLERATEQARCPGGGGPWQGKLAAGIGIGDAAPAGGRPSAGLAPFMQFAKRQGMRWLEPVPGLGLGAQLAAAARA